MREYFWHASRLGERIDKGDGEKADCNQSKLIFFSSFLHSSCSFFFFFLSSLHPPSPFASPSLARLSPSFHLSFSRHIDTATSSSSQSPSTNYTKHDRWNSTFIPPSFLPILLHFGTILLTPPCRFAPHFFDLLSNTHTHSHIPLDHLLKSIILVQEQSVVLVRLVAKHTPQGGSADKQKSQVLTLESATVAV